MFRQASGLRNRLPAPQIGPVTLLALSSYDTRFITHTGFPCSVVSNRLNSALCAKSPAHNALIFSLRNSMGVFFQEPNAVRAAVMAAVTSSPVDTGDGNRAVLFEGLIP